MTGIHPILCVTRHVDAPRLRIDLSVFGADGSDVSVTFHLTPELAREWAANLLGLVDP